MNKITWRSSVCLIILFFFFSTHLVTCTPRMLGQLAPTGTVAPSTGTRPSVQERQIAQAVFNAINKDRAAAGLSPLQWSDALARSARQHNKTMMAANQLSHQLPEEPGLGDRERQQGVIWMQAAENIGVTNELSEQGALNLHQAMMAEKPPDDGHRRNILNTQSNQLGVDILITPAQGQLWLTEDFAQVV